MIIRTNSYCTSTPAHVPALARGEPVAADGPEPRPPGLPEHRPVASYLSGGGRGVSARRIGYVRELLALIEHVLDNHAVAVVDPSGFLHILSSCPCGQENHSPASGTGVPAGRPTTRCSFADEKLHFP